MSPDAAHAGNHTVRAAARAFLGLGSNMGEPRAMLAAAAKALSSRPGITLLARSGDFRTPPWGDLDQPPFVNAALAIATTLGPEDLLAVCLATERQLGRDREALGARRWGPRLIDIDLLVYEGETRASETLQLPHPRLIQRAFALAPLADIAAELALPTPDGGTISVAEALAGLDRTGIERLEP